MLDRQTLEIVCVYNNLQLFEQMVSSTESYSDSEIKIVGIDNRNNQFSSAASAYNYALQNLCEAEVIVFCHQDIIWKSGALSDIYCACINDNNTLFGAAGVLASISKKNGCVSAITHPGHKFTSLSESEMIKVFSLDELMIAGNKELFQKVRFDPDTCFAWDLYAVDLCLQCHLQEINVVVIGLDIQHLSCGILTENYYKAQRAIAYKYHRNYSIIFTTCGWFFTNRILYSVFERLKKGKLFKKILHPVYQFFKYHK